MVCGNIHEPCLAEGVVKYRYTSNKMKSKGQSICSLVKLISIYTVHSRGDTIISTANIKTTNQRNPWSVLFEHIIRLTQIQLPWLVEHAWMFLPCITMETSITRSQPGVIVDTVA